MRETSFGQLDILLKDEDKPKVEHLTFSRSGRFHQHDYFESFTVLSGEGVVEYGEKSVTVKSGDTVTIPPKVPHRMIPNEGKYLEGLLWYHTEKGKWFS